MTTDGAWTIERHLADQLERSVDLFHRFIAMVEDIGPFTYAVSRSTITLKGTRRGFAGARPVRTGLRGYFDLQREVADPRITAAAPFSKKLFVHHFRLTSAADLDDEFAGWMREAYAVGAGAHLRQAERRATPDESEIPSLRPSQEWFADWPYAESTSVQVQATVTGPAAEHAIQRYVERLIPDPEARVADGVRLYYRGGYVVETTRPVDGGAWQVLVSSAGQDGFDSLLGAAEDLVAELRATHGEVRLTWRELPATRAGEAGQ